MSGEHVLAGGNVAAEVVRVGATVRKPVTPATPAVEALLRHLEAAGFAGAQPWARLHAEGHADHWGPAADYIDQHQDEWTRALLD